MLRTSIFSPNCNQSNRSEQNHSKQDHSSSSSKDINSMMMMRQSHSHQGTPNDVRLLFPMRRESSHTALAGSVTSSSPSIPIAPAELSESEIQLEDDEAKAQFREHAMYQRIFYSMRDNNNNNKAVAVPSLNRAESLPFFPVLPQAISLHNQADAAQMVQPLPSASAALPRNETWHDMQQGHHNMIGREFSFTTTNHNHIGPTSSSSSCCNDEDFVFEMDDM